MIIGRCTKCGGNLTLEKDEDTWQSNCLQCGNTKILHNVHGDSRRYDVTMPYTQSPSACSCNAFTTIPVFLHGFAEEEVLNASKVKRVK
jgi:predicted RNA-binding Zn-ribbon protein involved in translation (DUF1610 family)